MWRAMAYAAVALVLGCGDDAVLAPVGGGGGGGGAGGGGGGGGASGATSTLCPGITGGTAILWDLYNGVPRTDPVLPPPLPQPGSVYSHPSAPLLGFFYPAGWTPETIDGGIHDLGVNLVRGDGAAVWRQHTTTTNGVPSARELRDFEIGGALTFFGLTPEQMTVVCVNEATFDAGGGIPVSASNILIDGGGMTIVVVASVTPFPGLPSSSLRRQIVAAPSGEFSARAVDTFLAIDFQMLVGDSRNLFDSDGDGWRDGVDEFPRDPSRH